MSTTASSSHSSTTATTTATLRRNSIRETVLNSQILSLTNRKENVNVFVQRDSGIMTSTSTTTTSGSATTPLPVINYPSSPNAISPTVEKNGFFEKINDNNPNEQQQKCQQQQSNNSKSYKQIRDYLLDESQSNDSSFNCAFNLKEQQTYYWKKLSSHDHIKKLEPYFLMDSCEQIYRFKEMIKYVDIDNTECVYLFFEPHYGDLHSYMKEKKRLKESEAKKLFYQIVNAVKCCHENGIIVRDIKLKKFVFADSERTKILLTNLEDCLVLDDCDCDLIKSQQGCPAYVSPEVLNPNQTSYSGKLSDSWSLGIVLYTLLFGRYPFHHNVITTMFAKITKAKFQIPATSVTLNAKTLLRSLIRLKADERMLPDEILYHNWFKDTSMEFNTRSNLYATNKQNNNNNSIDQQRDFTSLVNGIQTSNNVFAHNFQNHNTAAASVLYNIQQTNFPCNNNTNSNNNSHLFNNSSSSISNNNNSNSIVSSVNGVAISGRKINQINNNNNKSNLNNDDQFVPNFVQ